MTSRASIGGFFFALIIGLVSIAPGAYAQPGEHGGRGGGQGRDPFAKLSLTADQQTRIAAIRSQFEQDTKSVREQMNTLHQQMRTARENNETARIEQLRAESEPLRARMKSAHDGMEQQVRSVLTAAQITQLDQMRSEHEKGEKGHGGRRGEKGATRQQGAGA